MSSVPASTAWSRRLLTWVTFAALYGLSIGVWLVFMLWVHFLESQGVGLFAIVPLAVAVPVFFGALLVHEGGHWAGSRLVGFRCHAVSVMRLHLERTDAGWRWRFGPRQPKRYGYVVALPLDYANYRRRQALYVGAGPAASLLAGLAAFALGWYLRPATLLSAGAPVAAFVAVQGLLGFGVYSGFIGLANLLPYRPTTDGSRLLQLVQGGPALTRQLALTRLSVANWHQRIRPRNWNPADIHTLLAHADHPGEECLAHYLAYAHALDRQETDAARQHLQRAIDLRQASGPDLLRTLYAEAAYCAAIITRHSANAQHWLRRMGEVAPLTDKDAFTQAAVACSCQDYATAQRLLQLCRTQQAALPESEIRTQGQERLDAVAALLQQQLPAPPVATPASLTG